MAGTHNSWMETQSTHVNIGSTEGQDGSPYIYICTRWMLPGTGLIQSAQ